MKVNELYKNYKNYTIMLFGKPLKEQTIPFTCLPKKPIEDCEIVDMKVEKNKHEFAKMDLNTRKVKFEQTEGSVYAFIK